MPRRVVPIWRLPSFRSRAPSRATCHGMIRCALPERNTRPAVAWPRPSRSSSSPIRTSGSTTQPAPIADALPATMPDGICADLVRLAVDDDRVPCVRPTLVAADEVGVLGEQVDDLALALVAPLRADDHGGRHVSHSCTSRGGAVRRTVRAGASCCAAGRRLLPAGGRYPGPRLVRTSSDRDDGRAVRAVRDGLDRRPARLVDEQPWCTVRRLVHVAPGPQRVDRGPEIPALLRQDVLVAVGPLLVALAGEDPLLDEALEPAGEHGAGDIEPLLEVVEAANAEEDVAEDQQRPALSDDLERAGERAVLGVVGPGQHSPDRTTESIDRTHSCSSGFRVSPITGLMHGGTASPAS